MSENSPQGNAPSFDPLNASRAEEDDMMAGFVAAGAAGASMPPLASLAFEHGWRMRRNDMAGVADGDQRELARRMAGARGKG